VLKAPCPQRLSMSPGWIMLLPNAHPLDRSVHARMWLLLRMYCVPPRVTSDPSVPPQHVIVFPLVLESF
jgi:hypothetical protein